MKFFPEKNHVCYIITACSLFDLLSLNNLPKVSNFFPAFLKRLLCVPAVAAAEQRKYDKTWWEAAVPTTTARIPIVRHLPCPYPSGKEAAASLCLNVAVTSPQLQKIALFTLSYYHSIIRVLWVHAEPKLVDIIVASRRPIHGVLTTTALHACTTILIISENNPSDGEQDRQRLKKLYWLSSST